MFSTPKRLRLLRVVGDIFGSVQRMGKKPILVHGTESMKLQTEMPKTIWIYTQEKFVAFIMLNFNSI